MAPPIALRNLVHGKTRTLVALGGVCFAVTLLFMQLGFFASVPLTAMLTYDALDYDVLLVSPNYVVLTQAGTFPRSRLYQPLAHADVRAVMPVYVTRHHWRNLETRFHRAVVVLGVKPSDPISTVPELAQQIPALARPDTVLVDRLSRHDVGIVNPGTITEVGPRNLETIGQFTIGPGYEAGQVIVSDTTFSQLHGGRPLRDVNLGLIKLRPGANAATVAEELQTSLPADVRVLTRAQLADKEQHYWLVSTSTGIIFGCGVLVAGLFGVVIAYQVLSMEVTQRLSEYATLKAIGFTDGYLARVVLKQALAIAILSYIPGYAIALAIYYVSRGVTNLPINMTVERAVGVFLANLLICSLSGLAALRILRRADPVELF
jgi:putative ABC transport system permease protein